MNHTPSRAFDRHSDLDFSKEAVDYFNHKTRDNDAYMTSEYDLLSHWFRIADWCAYNLQKDGYEPIVLAPLGEFSASATRLSQLAFESGDFMHRKTAASLLGWTKAPQLHLISEFLEKEVERDKSLAPEALERLECQSVVERLVFSAARWARSEEARLPALAFLADVVSRTIGGEYWNSSSYAMTTLVLYDSGASQELLVSFSKYANGPSPSHPSKPTLEQERQFVDNLAERNPNTLNAIENLLREGDDALSAELDSQSKRSITEFLEVADRFNKQAKLQQ